MTIFYLLFPLAGVLSEMSATPLIEYLKSLPEKLGNNKYYRYITRSFQARALLGMSKIALLESMNDPAWLNEDYTGMMLSSEDIDNGIVRQNQLNNDKINLNFAAKKVKKYIVPVNKVHNNLNRVYQDIDAWNNNEMIRVDVGNNVTTKIMIYINENQIQVTGKQQVTAYDRAVHNAVISLYESGNEYITPLMVYRTMSGRTDGESASNTSLIAVSNSLDKQMVTMVKIDCGDEAKMHNKIVGPVIEGNMLHAIKVTVSAGGQQKQAYQSVV
jgi:hypothetical protein